MNCMRIYIIVFFLLPAFNKGFSQPGIIDLTKNNQSPDRVMILDLLRTKVKPQIKQDVSFVVRSLQIKNNYAFLKGNVRDAKGGKIDFSKTIFKNDEKEGMFDGDPVYALFKKVNGKWKYLVHAIGPTDVVYACWASTYKAPKQLFDHNDDCGN